MIVTGLKLYHFPATRSARVKWMLHEVVGDGFEVEPVDLYGGAQYRSDFLSLNPSHNVPVLEIGWSSGAHQLMIESAAIVAFLADTYPDKGLAPPPGASPERADYLQMLHFGSTGMDMMLWQVRVHEHLLPDAERDPRTIQRYRTKFTEEVEPQLAARLEHMPYVCGETFTAADCVIGHNVLWARSYGLCQAEVFRRYLSTISKREAFKSAFSDARQFSVSIPSEKRSSTNFNG